MIKWVLQDKSAILQYGESSTRTTRQTRGALPSRGLGRINAMASDRMEGDNAKEPGFGNGKQRDF